MIARLEQNERIQRAQQLARVPNVMVPLSALTGNLQHGQHKVKLEGAMAEVYFVIDSMIRRLEVKYMPRPRPRPAVSVKVANNRVGGILTQHAYTSTTQQRQQQLWIQQQSRLHAVAAFQQQQQLLQVLGFNFSVLSEPAATSKVVQSGVVPTGPMQLVSQPNHLGVGQHTASRTANCTVNGQVPMLQPLSSPGQHLLPMLMRPPMVFMHPPGIVPQWGTGSATTRPAAARSSHVQQATTLSTPCSNDDTAVATIPVCPHQQGIAATAIAGPMHLCAAGWPPFLFQAPSPCLTPTAGTASRAAGTNPATAGRHAAAAAATSRCTGATSVTEDSSDSAAANAAASSLHPA